MNFFENFSITDTIMSFVPCLKDLGRKGKSAEEEDNLITYSKYDKIIAELPRGDRTYYCNYKGVWLLDEQCKGVMAAQDHFKSLPNDILLASFPEPGTTWLKTLIFSIVHRQAYLNTSASSSTYHHPILHRNPDDLILDLEHLFFAKDKICELDASSPQPRLFGTHMPCTILPNSIIESGSRIVYVCRNPKNTLVAQWRYSNRIASMIYAPAPELEDCFERYIKGESEFGPHWDHVLGYWKKSLEYPERVLFLKYEQLLEEPVSHVKRLAVFLGYPFSEDEERYGVVDKISKLSSDRPNHIKGKVNYWEDYLTSQMIQQLDHIIVQKFAVVGLTF